jgi:Putative  PD-(D/E)XK family member, (DUF4420)
MTTATIEELWRSLRGGPNAVHRRVDATHPFELYAEFEPPERYGLVLFMKDQPPEPRTLRSLQIDRGVRPDGLWWLRLSVEGSALQPVFAGLCRDVISFTRANVDEHTAASVILSRVDRWRKLLEGGLRGMPIAELRGLIGELVILEADVLPRCSAFEAITAWTGPLGTAQDFRLPSGQRIETKAVRSDSTSCQINGLDQLDAGPDPLVLAVVRLDETGTGAQGAITAPGLINTLRDRIGSDPAALNEFDSRLAAAGWHEHPDHENFVVRVIGIEHFPVADTFPRLVRADVPHGVLDAVYEIALPATGGGVYGDPS